MEVWLGARCSYRLLIVQENLLEGKGPSGEGQQITDSLKCCSFLSIHQGSFEKSSMTAIGLSNERHFHFDCCQLLNSYFHRKKQQNTCSSQNFTWNEMWCLEESSRSFKSLIFRIIWEQIKRKDYQDLLIIMYFF